MIKNVLNSIKLEIKNNYIFYIVIVFILLLETISLDYCIFSPGGLEELTNRIEIENSYKVDGSFNLTYVTSRKGTLSNLLLSYLIPNWDIVPLDDMRIEDEKESDIIERNKIYLKDTSYDAIIASFTEAGLKYDIDSLDLTVSYIYDFAKTNLEVGDIIKEINGIKLSNYEELTSELSKYKSGDKINLQVLRNDKYIDSYAILQENEGRIVIGVLIVDLKNIKTSPKVEYIFKDNESGSSRGLMCALEIYNRITEYDLTKGKIIAGTGTIDEKGNVGSIDGVKYKIIGAVKNKASVFIVPVDNYEEAEKIVKEKNYDIKLIKADNLHNVIEELKNI